MILKTIDITEAQISLKDLLSLIEEGTEIVLTEGETQRARLVPIAATTTTQQPRTPGLHRGVFTMSDDFAASLQPRTPDLHPGAFTMSDDFDDPLPDEFWEGRA